MHGHNYSLAVYLTGQEQDDIGRILDFKKPKVSIKGWIDANWDQTFVLWEKDDNGLAAIRSSEPHRIYELNSNPTAENMAIHFLEHVCPLNLERTVDSRGCRRNRVQGTTVRK